MTKKKKKKKKKLKNFSWCTFLYISSIYKGFVNWTLVSDDFMYNNMNGKKKSSIKSKFCNIAKYECEIYGYVKTFRYVKRSYAWESRNTDDSL